MRMLAFIVLGVAAGALSGLTGIGGGAIIVPALVCLSGFSVHLAEGTTLALLVPLIGILAAWNNYQKGYVDIATAMMIAVGFVVGSEIASRVAVELPTGVVCRIFALVLGLIATEMFVSAPRA